MPPWYTSVFKVDAPVNITALEDNGETTSFTLVVDGSTFTSADPSFIYTFTAVSIVILFYFIYLLVYLFFC